MSAVDMLDRTKVIETDTRLGPLFVEKAGEVVTRSLVEDGHWDPTISGLMKRVLRPGMTFVDAGANIGWFSVLGSRLVGPGGRVFSVEPDPLNLSILRANLERHDCSNVTVLPVAAWSERGELHFHRPAEEGAIGRVGQNDGSGVKVPAERLDELIEGRVDYVKVDCELSDHMVVQGIDGLFRENPMMLLSVEFHPWHESHLGTQPSQVLDVYRGKGLQPYEIVSDGIKPSTWEKIANPALPEPHIAFDFVMTSCPPRQLKPTGLLVRRSLLEWAGDLLERVPEPIRPRIRERDRRKPRAS